MCNNLIMNTSLLQLHSTVVTLERKRTNDQSQSPVEEADGGL